MTKPKEKWQKEFDKRFVGIKSHFSDWLTPENGETVKQFIQKVRDEAYKEGYAEGYGHGVYEWEERSKGKINF